MVKANLSFYIQLASGSELTSGIYSICQQSNILNQVINRIQTNISLAKTCELTVRSNESIMASTTYSFIFIMDFLLVFFLNQIAKSCVSQFYSALCNFFVLVKYLQNCIRRRYSTAMQVQIEYIW